jgi:RNA polymerase sigma-70 factor (ECF subfamily)
MRRCGAADTAAELTQETFLSAVRALRSGAAVREPLPWLMSIARGRLVDHFRRAGVRRRLRPPPPTSEEEPLSTHVDSALLNALQSVRNDQRTALLLRYVDDLPLAEVARVLGRSTSATESLLARGRKALAAAYREQEHD